MTFSFKLITFWLNLDGCAPQGFTPGLELGGRSNLSRDLGELPMSVASASLVGPEDQELLGGTIIFTGMVGKRVAVFSHYLLPSWRGGNHRTLCLTPMRCHQALRVGTWGRGRCPGPQFRVPMWGVCPCREHESHQVSVPSWRWPFLLFPMPILAMGSLGSTEG